MTGSEFYVLWNKERKKLFDPIYNCAQLQSLELFLISLILSD